MYRWVAAMTLALSLVAALVVLIRSAPQDTPTPLEPPRFEAEDELPAWTREPLPYPPLDATAEFLPPSAPGLSSAAAAEAHMRLEMRAALEADFQRMIGAGPFQRQQDANDTGQRYRLDPNWPRIPALPGVAGYEIQDCTGYRICVSDRLAQEADDPAWARPMESRVFEVISRVFANPLNQLHVVCRERTCGVLMPGAADQPEWVAYGKLMRMGEQLSDELQLPYATVAIRRDFQAIYLTNAEIDRSGIFTQ